MKRIKLMLMVSKMLGFDVVKVGKESPALFEIEPQYIYILVCQKSGTVVTLLPKFGDVGYFKYITRNNDNAPE